MLLEDKCINEACIGKENGERPIQRQENGKYHKCFAFSPTTRGASAGLYVLKKAIRIILI